MRQKINAPISAHRIAPLRTRLSALLAAVCFAFAAVVSVPAPAAAAATDVFALFTRLLAEPAVTLRFRQISYNQDGSPLDDIGGSLSYLRPAQFRLEYDDSSYPLIVSDGETIWIYEEDLAQVVTQPLNTAPQNGLIDVLAAGDINAINKDYTLSAGLGSSRLNWLNAEALHSNIDIRQFRLGFADDGVLREMYFTDHFDNTIRLTIDAIEYKVNDADRSFAFSPQDGVEVIEYR